MHEDGTDRSTKFFLEVESGRWSNQEVVVGPGEQFGQCRPKGVAGSTESTQQAERE